MFYLMDVMVDLRDIMDEEEETSSWMKAYQEEQNRKVARDTGYDTPSTSPAKILEEDKEIGFLIETTPGKRY